MQDRLNSLPEITKNLIIINVLMFLASMTFPKLNEHLAMYYFESSFFEPYQIVTHMFMHGGLFHIFFNMYGLFLFGSEIERVLGPKKFLFYYLATGLGAALLQSVVWYIEVNHIAYSMGELIQIRQSMNMTRVVGASGAIFGLLAAFGMMHPNRILQLIFPPIALPAKYFVLIYGAFELYLGVSNVNSGIAHFAHLGGAIFGALIILFWRQQGERF